MFKSDEVGRILEKAGYILKAAESLEIRLNLWNIQNIYVMACSQRASFLAAHKEAVKSFASRIQLNPAVLPENLR